MTCSPALGVSWRRQGPQQRAPASSPPFSLLPTVAVLDPTLFHPLDFQIWADPGKYALMGAAAQLGEWFSLGRRWVGADTARLEPSRQREGPLGPIVGWGLPGSKDFPFSCWVCVLVKLYLCARLFGISARLQATIVCGLCCAALFFPTYSFAPHFDSKYLLPLPEV